MHAMLLTRPARIQDEPLHLTQLDAPLPGPKQVRVAVRACAVCHTDLHIVEGEVAVPSLPIVPGHQIVGVVDSLGKGAGKFRVGDRVGIPWLNWTDGKCEYCERDEENLCENARFTGLHVNGGYAEYTIVHEDYAYPIPKSFDDTQAAPLLCAGAVGYRALRLSELEPGERLGIYGFGASGHLVMQIARHWNCKVYVFTRGAEHQSLARKMGAVWTGRAEETPPKQIDRAIIFAPIGNLVPEALRVMRKGGTVAHAGIHSTPIPEFDYNLLYHERTVRSVANSTRQDVTDFMRLAAEIPVRTEFEVFPLSEANRALRMMKESKLKASAVLEVA
jgi:propanol-preferring alcohol dehydrogenase